MSKLLDNSHRSDCLISIADVLDDIPALEVGIEQARKLSCGQRVYVLDYSVDRKKVIDEVYVTCQNDPLAIAKFENGTLLPIRVFKQYH